MSPIRPTPAGRTPHGVDRIIEVAFSDNIDLDSSTPLHVAFEAQAPTRRLPC